MERLSRQGIVDKVEAKRKQDEVVFLEATIRFDTGLMTDYAYNDDIRIDKIAIAFGALSGINPGDLVTFDMVVQSPLTQRFAPALTVGDLADEDDINEAVVNTAQGDE